MSGFFSYLTWFQVVLLMVGLMSGILSLFREVILINHPEKAKDHHLFWRCVFIAFIASAVWVWANEHSQVMDLRKRFDGLTISKLNAKYYLMTGRFDPRSDADSCAVIATGMITNQGAPTAIAEWSLALRFADGAEVKGEPLLPIPRNAQINLQNNKGVVLTGEKWWPGETDSTPIATGGEATGWVYFLFGMSPTKLWEHKPVASVLILKDVRDKEWRFEQPISEEQKNHFPELPGVTDQPQTPAAFVEPSHSLRRRTLRLVSELSDFWGRRPQPPQPVQNATTEEERQRNAAWDRYWQDAKTAYLNADFRERIVGIVREYKNKGISTGFLESAAEQPDRLMGAAPYGGWQLDNCFQYMSELCQLRELAYHVDAEDRPIFLVEKPRE